MQDDIALAARCAKAYRAFGFNPLPSRRDVKGPALSEYKDYWEQPCPEHVYETHATGNIQLTCGVYWGLVVIDLDGILGIEKWEEWTSCKPCPQTWTAESDPSRGRHLYFRTPAGVDSIESGRLWSLWDPTISTWKKRAAIEILADRKLVIAPPSINPETGKRVSFLPNLGPKLIPMPAELPAWILMTPRLTEPGRNSPRDHRSPSRSFTSSEEVLDRIPDKLFLATSWGLRLESHQPNGNGWVRCYRAGIDESNPSAGISTITGRYWEAGKEMQTLFDLAVILGAYGSWQEAKRDLEKKYCS